MHREQTVGANNIMRGSDWVGVRAKALLNDTAGVVLGTSPAETKVPC